jgi:hypothetical protein
VKVLSSSREGKQQQQQAKDYLEPNRQPNTT